MLTRCCAVPEPPKSRPAFKMPKRVTRARRVAKPKLTDKTAKEETKELFDTWKDTVDTWKDMTDTFDLDEE